MNVDPENPPFDFAGARERGPREPRSSETARLRRVLRDVVAAHKSGQHEPLQAAIAAAETVLADKSQ